MRIIFAGTPDFAATSLAALLASSHDVVAVLTQPDRPAGRGRKLVASDVKALAEAHALPVLQPERLKDPAIHDQLRAFEADVMVVVAYGLIIPAAVLDLPRYGCINVHGSLLPRWRGAAPVHRAIAAGDAESGVTIMQMDVGLDTGPMLHKVATPITAEDTGGSLYQRIATLGAEALVTVLDDLPAYLARATVQPEAGVTYAHKLTKDEGQLDWSRPAAALHDQVRAFNPWPVAWSRMDEQVIRVWASAPLSSPLKDSSKHSPGTVIAVSPAGIDVACGEGALRLTTLQLPGKKALPVADLLRGRPDLFQPGQHFDKANPS
ncbi:methionyl-tRNA formyltransferase [Alcanivorax sp. JB21]|uniref:methionyl-tRNA formyltransferase n=1 Tax=Alcanivorax limicola TaxID=2874102 RepID=UPI001CBD3AA0|nr:methionyl-tRNA formyltransferase [Alcanivorax limicola]MBZ2189020.1 methionyl-tRNA formyltransferase [Alcanivorax limicola]